MGYLPIALERGQPKMQDDHTPDEVLAELHRAREAWSESAKATNRPVPLPRNRPPIDQAPMAG